MIALLLSTLFAAAACLALGAIGSSWRNHGAAVGELRRQLRECRRTRESRYRLITTTVRLEELRPGATIHRVDFRPQARNLPYWTPPRFGLRAAA